MKNPGLQNKAAIPVDVKTNQTWLPSNPSAMLQALPAKPSGALFATPHKMGSCNPVFTRLPVKHRAHFHNV
jgi:hypothetical protein